MAAKTDDIDEIKAKAEEEASVKEDVSQEEGRFRYADHISKDDFFKDELDPENAIDSDKTDDKRKFVFLDKFPLVAKKAYLQEIKDFLYSDTEYENKDHNGQLSPVQLSHLILLAARIGYEPETYQDFIELISVDKHDYNQDPEFQECVLNDPEIQTIWVWSVAKDLISLNFKILQDEMGLDFDQTWELMQHDNQEIFDQLDPSSMSDEEFHIKYEEAFINDINDMYRSSDYIVKYLKDCFVGDTVRNSLGNVTIWAHNIEQYVATIFIEEVSFETDDKEYRDLIASMEEDIFISDMPHNALYFTGSPSGLRAIDYLGLLIKVYGFATKISSLSKAGLSLLTLSNPMTGVMGLATLGITGISYLAKNRDGEKRKFKLTLAKVQQNLYEHTRSLVKDFLDQTIEQTIDRKRDDFKKSIDFKPYMKLIAQLVQADNFLELQIQEYKRAQLEIALPVFIDRNRVKAITSGEKYQQVREFIFSCYYPANHEMKELRNRLKFECTLEELRKLQSIVGSLGYFSVTGIAKKALFIGR